jgi:acetoin utilization deacetylase AcuC-like enzyme
MIVSAGFDAHRDDPLADMALTAGDFADLTGRVAGLMGRPGRLVLFLEGGYDLRALRASVGACAARLVDTSYRPEAASSGGTGLNRVARYRSQFLGIQE